MADNKINYDEIQEEYLDTIIRLAYKDAEDEEVQALLQEDDEAAATVPPEAKEAAFRLFLEKLEQEEKQASRQAHVVQWKRVLPRIVNVAACIILILGIAAPFAVAHVDAIRVRVMELLIDIQDDHTELSFKEDEEKEFYVPAEWTGLCYPSYIPDGFVLTEMGKLNCYVVYKDENGRKINFSEYAEADSVSINSENAELSYPVINGMDVFLIERPLSVIATWATEERFYVLTVNVPKEEAIAIIEGVRRIAD